MGSRHARERREQMSEFHDHDQEYKETESPDAAIRREKAIVKLSPEDALRCRERKAGRVIDEAQHRRDLLRKVQFSGFRRKD